MEESIFIFIKYYNRIHKYVKDISTTEKEEHRVILYGLRVYPCQSQEIYGYCYEAETTRKGREYAHVLSSLNQHDCFYYHTFMDQRRCPITSDNCESYRPAKCQSYNSKTGKCKFGPNCIYSHGYYIYY